MRFLPLTLTLMFSITSFFGCAQKKVDSRAYDLTLKALLSHTVPEVEVPKAPSPDSAIYVDARAKAEYEVSRIPGAVWVGYDDFDLKRVSSVDKNAKVIVYCSVGYRSEKISEKLRDAGFADVSNLYGGIFEWKNQGNEVVNESGPTDSVHAFDKTWGVWLKKGTKVYNK